MNDRVKPRAELDLIEIFAFIAQDKIAPGDRLLEVAEESFGSIARTPAMGRRWESKNPKLRDIRVYSMPAPYRSYLIFS